MKIEKNTKISLIYIVLLYLLYNFLFQKFDYTIRYLINFVFLVNLYSDNWIFMLKDLDIRMYL